jgi:hypothetical protein
MNCRMAFRAPNIIVSAVFQTDQVVEKHASLTGFLFASITFLEVSSLAFKSASSSRGFVFAIVKYAVASCLQCMTAQR